MKFHKFLQIPKRLNGENKGFTLIETLVATSIFIITMVIISQIYVSAMRAERITYALLQNEESVRYALDTMSKTIRMGKDFTGGDNELDFQYFYKGEWKDLTYSFTDNTIKRDFMDSGLLPLLPPEVKIENGKFDFESQTSDSQAFVTISFKVISTVGGREYGFDIETAVTPRVIFEIED